MRKTTLSAYPALGLRLAWALFLLWCSRFVFFLFNQHYFSAIDLQGWGSVLWGGLRFDIAAICYLNSLYVLLQVIPLKARFTQSYQKFTQFLFLVTNGFALLANFADTFYFPFYENFQMKKIFLKFYLPPHCTIGIFCRWLYFF